MTRYLLLLCAVSALIGCEKAPEEPADPAALVASLASADAILESVQTLVREGELDRADAVMGAAVAAYPGDIELRLAYGELLIGRGAGERAYAQYAEAIRSGADDPAVAFAAGTAAELAGLKEDAVERFAEATEGDATSAPYAVRHGLACLSINDLDGARASLLRATTLDPANAIAWGSLAEIALRKNEAEIAVRHAQAARTFAPDEPAWLVIEARALKRQGDAEAALLLLRTLPEADRWTGGVLSTESECLGLLGRPGEAGDLYEAAAERSSGADVGRYWHQAAVWAERAGDADTARARATRSADSGSDAGRALLDRLDG